MNVRFEAMEEKHGAEVMEIFNYYVEHGFSAYPETRLPERFFDKFLEITKGYPAFVNDRCIFTESCRFLLFACI